MYEDLSKFMTICSLKWKILQISAREKAIWSPVSIIPNQPREANTHARQYTSYVSYGMEIMQAIWSRKDDTWTCKPSKGWYDDWYYTHMCRDSSLDGLYFILSSDVEYDTWTMVKQFYAVILQFWRILLRICYVWGQERVDMCIDRAFGGVGFSLVQSVRRKAGRST